MKPIRIQKPCNKPLSFYVAKTSWFSLLIKKNVSGKMKRQKKINYVQTVFFFFLMLINKNVPP